MKKETVIWLGLIAAVAGISLYVYFQRSAPAPEPAPQNQFALSPASDAPALPAPSFELTDQTGAQFSSDDLAGKIWIVNFIVDSNFSFE